MRQDPSATSAVPGLLAQLAVAALARSSGHSAWRKSGLVALNLTLTVALGSRGLAAMGGRGHGDVEDATSNGGTRLSLGISYIRSTPGSG